MNKKDFDLLRIKKCELVDVNGQSMIQFIGTGDRHKMMKNDDGSICIINLPEQGKDFNYKAPLPIDKALDILDQSGDMNHKLISLQIRSHLAHRA